MTMLLKFKYVSAVALLFMIDCSCLAQITVTREDYDVFYNPTFAETAQYRNCTHFKAVCFDPTGTGERCRKCNCSGEYKTFVPRTGEQSSCVKDNYLLSFPAGNNSFLVQNQYTLTCLTYNSSENNVSTVNKTTCNPGSPSQLWVWTQYKQLINEGTSKCLQQGSSNGNEGEWFAALGECNTTTETQKWVCPSKKKSHFRLREQGENDLGLTTSKYLIHKEPKDDVLVIEASGLPFGNSWQRYSHASGKSLCAKASGCYGFVQDFSPILLVDTNCSQCQEAEIDTAEEQNKNECFIVLQKSQQLSQDGKWTHLNVEENVFSFVKKEKTTFLKWNFTNAENEWIGLIVKLHFYCAQKQQDEPPSNISCVVIKFKGTHTYPTPAPPTTSMTTPMTPTTTMKISSITPTTAATPMTTASMTTTLMMTASMTTTPMMTASMTPSTSIGLTAITPTTVTAPTTSIKNESIISTLGEALPTKLGERREDGSSTLLIAVVAGVTILLLFSLIVGILYAKQRIRTTPYAEKRAEVAECDKAWEFHLYQSGDSKYDHKYAVAFENALAASRPEHAYDYGSTDVREPGN